MALVPHQSRNSSISRHFRGFRAATDTLRECENYTAYSEHIHVYKDPVGLLFQRIFYRIADKQQRKMEMLFFVAAALV